MSLQSSAAAKLLSESLDLPSFLGNLASVSRILGGEELKTSMKSALRQILLSDRYSLGIEFLKLVSGTLDYKTTLEIRDAALVQKNMDLAVRLTDVELEGDYGALMKDVIARGDFELFKELIDRIPSPSSSISINEKIPLEYGEVLVSQWEKEGSRSASSCSVLKDRLIHWAEQDNLEAWIPLLQRVFPDIDLEQLEEMKANLKDSELREGIDVADWLVEEGNELVDMIVSLEGVCTTLLIEPYQPQGNPSRDGGNLAAAVISAYKGNLDELKEAVKIARAVAPLMCEELGTRLGV